MGSEMTIKEWAEKIYNTAKAKGWYDNGGPTPLERHMLIVTEVAEASEEVRNKKDPIYVIDGKPEGEAIELADVVIRVMDYFEHKGWDLESAIKMKCDYNDTRSYKHGGKAL